MFSATFSKDIKKLAMGILHKPVQLKLHQKTLLLMLLLKKYILLQKKKTELIIKLITETNWKQILVFTRQNKVQNNY
jgi:ATP-dependent RNA helicase RhlE